MKRVIKIIMLSIGWVFACWMLSACSSAMEEPDNGISDGSTATLTIHTAVPGAGTRADDIPEREKIDRLRIIVVDKETNIVDYDRLHIFPYRDGSTYTIDLDKGGKKYLYLLANTEDLDLDIPFKGEDWDNAVDDYDDINPSLPEGRLPFTSKYEVEVAEEEEEDTDGDETTEGDAPADGDGTTEGGTPADGDGATEGDAPADVVPEIPEDYTCYIAIAAVKFSFTFTNGTGNDIVVSDFKISSIADRSYLFPHNKEWDEWVENVTGDGEKKYFTNYEIPSDEHDVFTVPIPSSGNEGESEAGTGTSASSFTVLAEEDNNTYTIPDFYCHESKHILPFPDAKDQQYFIQFTIGGKEYVAEIQGLKSLIRSTHVIVNININKLSEDVTHDIVVWGKITDWKDLDPVEGGLEEVEP